MWSAERLKEFARKDRIYLLMLIFIVAVNVLSAVSPLGEKKKDERQRRVGKLMSSEEILVQQQHIEEMLKDNKTLAVVLPSVFFLSSFVLLWGLVSGIRCLMLKLSGRDVMTAYGSPPDVTWGVADIFRVMVVIFFIGYIAQFAESGIFRALGFRKPDEKLVTVLTSTVTDVIAVLVVLFFVVEKFKSGIRGLGITVKNVWRDIRIGIAGYVTLLPLLALIMIIVLSVLELIKYEQPISPALELFYGDSRPKLLLVLTALVTFLGPIAEELFFRGFAYPVLRRKIGIKGAMILVSAVFSLLHLNVISFLPIFALGLLLAYLYEKTGSLIPAITVHMIHNMAVVFFVYLYRSIAIPG